MAQNFVDIKHTVWKRLHFNDETDMEKIAEMLSQQEDIIDDSLGFKFAEDLCETEDTMSIEENGGEHTIEVYSEADMIWDNKNRHYEKDKEN